MPSSASVSTIRVVRRQPVVLAELARADAVDRAVVPHVEAGRPTPRSAWRRHRRRSRRCARRAAGSARAISAAGMIALTPVSSDHVDAGHEHRRDQAAARLRAATPCQITSPDAQVAHELPRAVFVAQREADQQRHAARADRQRDLVRIVELAAVAHARPRREYVPNRPTCSQRTRAPARRRGRGTARWSRRTGRRACPRSPPSTLLAADALRRRQALVHADERDEQAGRRTARLRSPGTFGIAGCRGRSCRRGRTGSRSRRSRAISCRGHVRSPVEMMAQREEAR